MKEDKIFVDTNVLVYAFDISAGVKHEKAKEIVENCWRSENGIISTQVLASRFKARSASSEVACASS